MDPIVLCGSQKGSSLESKMKGKLSLNPNYYHHHHHQILPGLEHRTCSVFWVWKKAGVPSKFQVNLQERDLLEGLGLDGRTILAWILQKYVSLRGIGQVRRRIGNIGELLFMGDMWLVLRVPQSLIRQPTSFLKRIGSH